MTGLKSGSRNISGKGIKTGYLYIAGFRNISGVEFESGYGYVSGKRIKAG